MLIGQKAQRPVQEFIQSISHLSALALKKMILSCHAMESRYNSGILTMNSLKIPVELTLVFDRAVGKERGSGQELDG